MKIIITAAGLGSRFQKIGIKVPKFAIIAKNKTLFYWSMISLKKFFQEEFIFIFRKETYDKKFIDSELKKLGIKKYKIVLLDKLTDGQAETVMLAKKHIKKDDSILIYNIDTHVKPSSISKTWFKYDGLIVTMNAKGDHWSFAKTNNKGFATAVTEKVKISNHASIGLYYFKKFSDFESIYKKYKPEIVHLYKEIYICPMYKYLIDQKKGILVKDVPLKSVVCLGTPDEVKVFDPKFLSKN